MIETAFVSAEIGGGFVDASGLHEIGGGFVDASGLHEMKSEAVEEERQRMKPKGSKVLTSKPTRVIEEMGATACSYEIGLTAAEMAAKDTTKLETAVDDKQEQRQK
jgi:hypothetical protein